jgi:hypothetical protein
MRIRSTLGVGTIVGVRLPRDGRPLDEEDESEISSVRSIISRNC